MARELARRGAQVTGLDLAPNLLALARRNEEQEPLGIEYVQGDAERAEQLRDRQFTGCVCIMALINIPDLYATFQSARRILKPGGWFVFAIPHPCFETPHAQWALRLCAAGFALERALEPGPSARQAELVPGNRECSTLLLIRAHLSDDRLTEKGSTG